MGAALLLLAFCVPAGAATYTYEGQIRIQPASGPCSPVTGGTFTVHLYGRDNGPLRIEAYLFGQQIAHAHIGGNSINQLGMIYAGESQPSHLMRLRQVGKGEFEGDLEAKSMVAALYLCPFSKATIRFHQIAGSPSDFSKAAELFRQDEQAVNAYVMGINGKFKEAAGPARQILAEKQQLYPPDHPQLLPYYYFVAALDQQLGAYPHSAELLKKGLAVCEKSYGPKSACTALLEYQLGSALVATGDNAGSEAAERDAVAITSRILGQDSPVLGLSLNALSVPLIYTGRFAEAESTLNRARRLNYAFTNSDNDNVGVSLIYLSVLYRQTGQYQKAESALRKACAIDQKVHGQDSPLTVVCSVVLAQVLRVEKQYPEAERLARSSLKSILRILGPERPDHPDINVALLGLGDILSETGRYAEAEPLYTQAMNNAVKYLGSDSAETAVIGLSQAKLLQATGRDDQALVTLKRAYAVSHVSSNQIISWRVPAALMELYASGKLANRTLAIFYGKEAVNDLQRIRGNLSGSTEVQSSFVSAEEVGSVYRQLANLLITDSRLSEAQQVLAMVKEQELYDFTAHAAATSAAAPQTVARLNASESKLDELANQEVTLGKELGALQDKFAKQGESFSAADRARLAQLHKAMDAAQSTFDARVADVARSSSDPEAQKRRQHEMVDFSTDFEASLRELGHNAVVAQYFIENDRVAILLTTPDAVVARESPIKRSQLNALILGYRKTLGNPNQDPLPQAQALYKILIGPIAGDLRQAGAKTLMLSLDDTLRYLPFAALHDGQKYLVESMSIAIVTDAVRDKLGKKPNSDWSVYGLGITKGGRGYEPLPYAAVELNGIAGQKGILNGKVMLDGAFTETSLRDGLDQSFPVIHIASHFQFTPGSMDDSFLLLGDGSQMTLAQIKTKLNFKNVELLTLSACDTALGDNSTEHHGAEVEGLGAIAQQSGAKAVLATLWPVADESTATLMRALYQAHKVDHLDKADSLRQAQLALLHGTGAPAPVATAQRGLARVSSAAATSASFRTDPKSPYAHPYYWAPFILMGNWL
ncbi:MAG TPA: CHAT domain-containing protein [Steroidobacteraceae bacterium]|nr:CHAT domain-containing protein [Steroidobacteraceae bacterium]